MKNPAQQKKNATSIMVFVWALAVIWTIVIAASAAWNTYRPNKRSYEMALIEAKNSFKKDIAYRRWNAMQGIVYVPATEYTPPNPYLTVPERDVVTKNGKRLTMVNPAYMTRQVYELMQKDLGVLGHITSLNPIRPENKPDAWEARALQLFNEGRKEFSSVEKINDKIYMRYMAPLITEKSCLKCHASQGYREGEIRGGISISIPMDVFKAIARKDILWRAIAHGLLWLIGLGVLAAGSRRVMRSESERNRIEEHLQLSEKKYRNIFENAVEGMFQVAPEGYFISINPALASMQGYDSPEDMIKSVTDAGKQLYVNPEDRIRYKDVLEKDGKVENFEVQLRKKDGAIIWASLNARAVKDSTGKILYFEGIVKDITAHKEAEEALLKYSQEVADLYNHAPCGYHSLSPDGTFVNINDTELTWLGYKRDEIVGIIKFSDLLTADKLPEYAVNLRKLNEQGWIKDIEYEMIRKDNTVFPVLLNSTLIKDKDNNFIMSRATIFDITELKRAEKELHLLNETLEQRVQSRTEEMKQARRVALSMMQDAEKERERAREALEKVRESSEQLKVLSSAVEQSPSSVMITDRSGLIEYVNPKFEQLTGYNAGEALSKTPRILKSGFHDNKFYENLWNTILSGKEWHGEVCNKKKSGDLYWEQASISAVRNEAGDITYFISVREDISERKRLDEELKERMEELERFSRLTIDREERMIKLKEEINALLEKLGEENKYKIVA
jgi:PAS domain S-box-containing protein